MNLETIYNLLLEIKASIAQIPQKKPPLPPGANTTGRKWKCYGRKLRAAAWREPSIRVAVLTLRREGWIYKDIATYVREHWPPALWVSKSAIHRFCVDARNGRLLEFGISDDL